MGLCRTLAVRNLTAGTAGSWQDGLLQASRYQAPGSLVLPVPTTAEKLLHGEVGLVSEKVYELRILG